MKPYEEAVETKRIAAQAECEAHNSTLDDRAALRRKARYNHPAFALPYVGGNREQRRHPYVPPAATNAGPPPVLRMYAQQKNRAAQ